MSPNNVFSSSVHTLTTLHILQAFAEGSGRDSVVQALNQPQIWNILQLNPGAFPKFSNPFAGDLLGMLWPSANHEYGIWPFGCAMLLFIFTKPASSWLGQIWRSGTFQFMSIFSHKCVRFVSVWHTLPPAGHDNEYLIAPSPYYISTLVSCCRNMLVEKILLNLGWHH